MSRTIILLLSCMGAISSPGYASSCGNPDPMVEKSIAKITSDRSSGSGVVVSKGMVLTASHVLDNPEEIKVTIDHRTRTAHLLSRNKNIDLALLAVDTGEARPIPIRHGALKASDPVWSVGYTFGKQLTSGRGAFRGNSNGLLYTSAPVNYGQSGGGILSCENGHHVLSGIIRAFGAEKKNGKLIRRADISAATRTEDTRYFVETGSRLASAK